MYRWVHQAARILDDEAPEAATRVRRRLAGLLGAMSRRGPSLGPQAKAAAHFVKVSRSYWPGLFHCYRVADLPRTNNDLEQFFGRHRYHERRASGRKAASPGLVLRGQARIIAAAATRLRRITAADLSAAPLERLRELRLALEARRQRRVHRRRFRKDPQAYLAALEEKLLQSTLPV